MLALHQNAERLRRADNLLPTREGGLATRPGAIQVIAGDVDQAKPWGDRILAEKAGRLVVWDGTETDVCAAGLVLQASAFQALTTSAAREDRLYVADGISNLWFLARRSGAYVREDVVNTILDATGAPYPLPIPSAIATWRNRLWLGSSSNRLTHCQNDRPAEWDPLYTVECQGKEPDRVRAIQPHGDVLVVGLGQALWGVTGDSQFNWQRAEIAGFGVTSADAIASDKVSFYWAADTGIYTLGGSEPLSDDIRELFSVAVGPAHVAIDRRRRLVLALVAGRLLAMHQDRPGLWGEIVGSSARGLLQLSQRIGWYGADGVWLLGARDTADKLLDGSERAFTSRYDTWEQRPNLGGRGRALLNRAVFGVLGSSRANATYTVIAADDTQERTFSQSMSLADETVDTWSDSIETETALDWPTRPVRRELVPRLSGQSFRHIVTAPCFMEIKAFEPQYRFGQGGRCVTVVVNRFDEDNPFELDKLNENFQALIAAINALAADDVLSLGVIVDSSPQYMPKTGGTFTGQVAMPSAIVGGAPVVTTATAATSATRGAVKMALAVADLAAAISNPPSQAEVTAIRDKVNALMASLRVAGVLAP